MRSLATDTLNQGSQTQINRGYTFRGKSLRGPYSYFRVRRTLRAVMWKNMSYLLHNLNIFCTSMIKISNYFCLYTRESQGACLRPLLLILLLMRNFYPFPYPPFDFSFLLCCCSFLVFSCVPDLVLTL